MQKRAIFRLLHRRRSIKYITVCERGEHHDIQIQKKIGKIQKGWDEKKKSEQSTSGPSRLRKNVSSHPLVCRGDYCFFSSKVASSLPLLPSSSSLVLSNVTLPASTSASFSALASFFFSRVALEGTNTKVMPTQSNVTANPIQRPTWYPFKLDPVL